MGHDPARLAPMTSTANPLNTLPQARDGVLLRPWQEKDLEPYRFWLAPHQDWHRWDAPYYPPLEQEQIDAVIASVTHSVNHHDGWMWEVAAADPTTAQGLPNMTDPVRRTVIADQDSDELLGTVSWYWESELCEYPRMGIQIFDPQLRGAGRGRAALDQWTSYLFGATQWQRVDYATWSGNRAMLSLGEKLGFTVQQRFRNARVVGGTFYDSVIMGVLRSDWNLQQKTGR